MATLIHTTAHTVANAVNVARRHLGVSYYLSRIISRSSDRESGRHMIELKSGQTVYVQVERNARGRVDWVEQEG